MDQIVSVLIYLFSIANIQQDSLALKCCKHGVGGQLPKKVKVNTGSGGQAGGCSGRSGSGGCALMLDQAGEQAHPGWNVGS